MRTELGSNPLGCGVRSSLRPHVPARRHTVSTIGALALILGQLDVRYLGTALNAGENLDVYAHVSLLFWERGGQTNPVEGVVEPPNWVVRARKPEPEISGFAGR